ncbi:MAG: twin-arginine translocase TatA/TatE family subunit [Longimicrobiales bacterium]|nr:twin-arginine translocase TatA/TatE family subunit [Longimicrobiales bacterium]
MNGLMLGLGLITFGVWEALLVFGILMLLFGAKKLPDLARGLGSGIRNFKGELKAPEEESTDEADEVERQP